MKQVNFLQINTTQREAALECAKKHGWVVVMKEYPFMVRFKKQFNYSIVHLDLHWNGGGLLSAISTHMKHPKKGKGKMYRKLSHFEDLEKYFKNPRVHTRKGYKKK